MTANTSGRTNLPNALQNIPISSQTLDASHIICGQINTEPTWLQNQIHIKGTLIFESPYDPPHTYKIVANDQLSGIECLSSGIINGGGEQFNLSFNTSTTITTNQILLETPQILVNQIPSSQYYIVYGQSKGEGMTSEQFHLNFPNPEIGKPDINIRMFGYNDMSMWFANDQYNQPDNNFITYNGNCFRFQQLIPPPNVAPNYMIEIEFCFQLRYNFNGDLPRDFLACGLYCQDTNEIVPQSLTWIQCNRLKFKYQTFSTKFTMRNDNSGFSYFPFYQNQSGNGFSDTDVGGRSWIKFKFYQFVTY